MDAKKKPVQLPNELIAQIIAYRLYGDLLEFEEDLHCSYNFEQCVYCGEDHLIALEDIRNAFPTFQGMVESITRDFIATAGTRRKEIEDAQNEHRIQCVRWEYKNHEWVTIWETRSVHCDGCHEVAHASRCEQCTQNNLESFLECWEGAREGGDASGSF